MTSMWMCDVCGETETDRGGVMLVEFDGKPSDGLHVHPDCLPDGIRGEIL